MNRLFSIRRRRPHIVDVIVPLQAGVDGYRLQWATNFDAAFTTFLTSTNIGFIDANVNRAVIDATPTTGTSVRIVFDPTTYAIPDASAFWLRFVPVTGGVAGTPGAATLVLPSTANHGVGVVVIAGTAPSASRLQLDLPLVQNIEFTNKDGANPLLVSSEDTGPQMSFLALQGVETYGFLGTQGTLYVQGSGGNVPFSASFTVAFPR